MSMSQDEFALDMPTVDVMLNSWFMTTKITTTGRGVGAASADSAVTLRGTGRSMRPSSSPPRFTMVMALSFCVVCAQTRSLDVKQKKIETGYRHKEQTAPERCSCCGCHIEANQYPQVCYDCKNQINSDLDELDDWVGECHEQK